MKTKEIEVWVSPSLVDNARTGSEFVYSPIYGKDEHVPTNFTKAKLIVEIPENKIEITERELDLALEFCGSSHLFRQSVCKKLFGKAQ